ncbi:type VI secretion system-associated FHA domain protein TagH [Alkalimonas collagenimarina]|uniref:Type VI secretion system-associated FHA domain protein TagH n=1 Tax=Alkalimonas collagenimarina TaxID=400390 RepID=A0ABT9H303_9GAMM|nr:type VI secretion system-associated FHA domain protein TagH [Alkalimonas collagenimarina]MDP4537677.1 type VI secretion system-associated FHA domain protein TagH [Alkalimonas collagenimarina]
MWLELSVVSYHRLSPRLQSVMRFDAEGGTIGRSDEASWQLADPERIVSGTHALIGFDNTGFYIEDRSTNGLFVNSPSDLVGKGNRRYLKEKDTLLLGDYELQVSRIDLQQMQASVTSQVVVEEAELAAVTESAMTSQQSNANLSGVLTHDLLDHSSAPSSQDFDSQLDDFFHIQPLIPDDWSEELPQDVTKQESNAVFGTVGVPLQQTDTELNTSSTSSLTISDERKVRAFMQGLELTAEQIAMLDQSEQSWQQLGEALRASLDGLMVMMRARSQIKNTLRVNQTTFQARENNPLKFSASFQDVFHTLFENNNTGFLKPKQSVQSAFQDITKHESALVAASSASAQALLERLSPVSIRTKDVGSGVFDKLSPLHVKSRYWAMYELYHKELTEQVKKNSKRGFSEDFIDAYEHSIKSDE